jgi:ADP-heptose:LPS heptosyltransferase
VAARRGYFTARNWARLPARRVALIACHWIGDTFWATQVLPALERRFPEAECFAVCKPATGDLWHGLLPPERILPAPQVVSDRRRERVSWWAIRRRAKQLRAIGFDLVIDLTGNRYSAAFTYWLRPAASLGFGGGELGWLYSHRVADAERPGRHLSERPFRVIEPLLAPQPDPFAYRLPLRPPTPTCAPGEIKGRLGVLGRPYFVLAPGAGWPAKEWPPEKFQEVARFLAKDQDKNQDSHLFPDDARPATSAKMGDCPDFPDFPSDVRSRRASGENAIVVVGSAAEEALCQRVAEGIPGATVLAGAPLGRVIALLADAQGVLANDSGIAHLAAALGRRTAAVFTGATDPEICRPLGKEGASRIFSHADAPEHIIAYLLGS